MLWHFKRYRYLYVITNIIFIILMISFNIKINGKALLGLKVGFYESILVWILLSFIVAFICNRFASKDLEKIIAILTDKCNPGEFIEVLSPIVNENPFRQPHKTTLLLSLSNGFLENGNYNEAKNILKSIITFSKGINGINEKIVYYNNLIIFYIKNSEFSDAKITLDYMRKLLDNSPSVENVYHDLYTQRLMQFSIEQGKFENAEQFYIQAFTKSKSNLTRINTKLELGKVYLHLEKFDLAKEAFEYVIENGNTLQAVKDAELNLHKINTL